MTEVIYGKFGDFPGDVSIGGNLEVTGTVTVGSLTSGRVVFA